MKTVFLKGCDLTHERLADAFGFPAYYGRNLDALHDCLCDIAEDTAILVADVDGGDPAARRILAVLRDSAEENPHLELYLAARLA